MESSNMLKNVIKAPSMILNGSLLDRLFSSTDESMNSSYEKINNSSVGQDTINIENQQFQIPPNHVQYVPPFLAQLAPPANSEANPSDVDIQIDDPNDSTASFASNENNRYFHSTTSLPFRVNNIHYNMEPTNIQDGQNLIMSTYQNQMNPLSIYHPGLNYQTLHMYPSVGFMNHVFLPGNNTFYDPSSLNLMYTNALPITHSNYNMTFAAPRPIENESSMTNDPTNHLIRPSVILLPNSKHGNKGLNPELINLFPIIKYKESDNSNENQKSENKSCSICLENYKNSDELRILICFHQFHLKCIDEWLGKNESCPCCRVDLNHLFDIERRINARNDYNTKDILA